MTLGTFFLVYLLGGLTFIPLVLAISVSILYIFWRITPDSTTKKLPVVTGSHEKPLIDDKNVHLFGWLRVTREFDRQPESQTYTGMVIKGIRGYINKNSQPKREEDMYYAVLKHQTLYLYESDKQQETHAVINLGLYHVGIHPEDLLDNECYFRENAIRLRRRRHDELDAEMAEHAQLSPTSDSNDYFVFSSRPVDKEDWYFALRSASILRSKPLSEQEISVDEDPTYFDQADMNKLIQSVHSSDKHRSTQFLNALLGRIFLGIYKTDTIREFIRAKIVRKFQKIKHPSFLGPIHVRDVHLGDSIPQFTSPRLLELSSTGELDIQVDVCYAGGLRIEIETEGTWTYSQRYKPIKVNIVLSVVVDRIEGRVLAKIKPPPSNRLWYGFYEKPNAEFRVEPVVSDKQVKWSVVTNAIEGRIREMLMETTVLPNMDDTPFFNTKGMGGIFGSHEGKEIKKKLEKEKKELEKKKEKENESEEKKKDKKEEEKDADTESDVSTVSKVAADVAELAASIINPDKHFTDDTTEKGSTVESVDSENTEETAAVDNSSLRSPASSVTSLPITSRPPPPNTPPRRARSERQLRSTNDESSSLFDLDTSFDMVRPSTELLSSAPDMQTQFEIASTYGDTGSLFSRSKRSISPSSSSVTSVTSATSGASGKTAIIANGVNAAKDLGKRWAQMRLRGANSNTTTASNDTDSTTTDTADKDSSLTSSLSPKSAGSTPTGPRRNTIIGYAGNLLAAASKEVAEHGGGGLLNLVGGNSNKDNSNGNKDNAGSDTASHGNTNGSISEVKGPEKRRPYINFGLRKQPASTTNLTSPSATSLSTTSSSETDLTLTSSMKPSPSLPSRRRSSQTSTQPQDISSSASRRKPVDISLLSSQDSSSTVEETTASSPRSTRSVSAPPTPNRDLRGEDAEADIENIPENQKTIDTDEKSSSLNTTKQADVNPNESDPLNAAVLSASSKNSQTPPALPTKPRPILSSIIMTKQPRLQLPTVSPPRPSRSTSSSSSTLSASPGLPTLMHTRSSSAAAAVITPVNVIREEGSSQQNSPTVVDFMGELAEKAKMQADAEEGQEDVTAEKENVTSKIEIEKNAKGNEKIEGLRVDVTKAEEESQPVVYQDQVPSPEPKLESLSKLEPESELQHVVYQDQLPSPKLKLEYMSKSEHGFEPKFESNLSPMPEQDSETVLEPEHEHEPIFEMELEPESREKRELQDDPLGTSIYVGPHPLSLSLPTKASTDSLLSPQLPSPRLGEIGTAVEGEVRRGVDAVF